MRLPVGAARVGRALGYLLAVLATAVVSVVGLPLLWQRRARGAWARWHQRRAGRLVRNPVEPHCPALGRYFKWLPVHVLTAVPFGLVALVCVGNLLVAAVVTPLWWAFPAEDPPRLLVEFPVTGWAAALTLGTTQILVLGALAYWALPVLAQLHARLTLALLAPSASELLTRRVVELTRTRSEVLEAHSAELRRIERDLHDGTQARLVAIAARLAVARDALAEPPPLVDRCLREAHVFAEEATVELREVIRGIYPPILADRGLPGALQTVAARAAVPTRVDVREIGQVPAAVEAVAYFAVAEALTNVAKHSQAGSAELRVRRTGDRLTVAVIDDGVGGAGAPAAAEGTGLAGIHRRVQALDGTLEVTSPPGGPTVVTVELPCG